jgi:hypothetical protein
MTVAQIITLARAITHTNSAQVSDAQALIFLNAVYHDKMASVIQMVGEDLFFDVWLADAVASQANGEYILPAPDASNAGMLKLKQLFVKVNSTDTYYTKARQVDLRSLPNDWNWYLENQPMSDPVYFVADQSFFLAPNFTATTAGGGGNAQLKLMGIKREIDLVDSGAEATILLPREFHTVLAIGMKRWIYDLLGKTGEKNDAINEDALETNKMLSALSDRDISLGQASLPQETDLE